jgi:hypothetical protein
MHKINPPAGQGSKSSKVHRCRQPLCFEATHLARRCRAALSRLAADDPAHRRIVTQALGIVDILISGEPPKHGLPEQPSQCVPTILARARIGQRITGHRRQSESVIEFTIGEQASIRGDCGAPKLERQAAVEILAQAAPKISASSGECGWKRSAFGGTPENICSF